MAGVFIVAVASMATFPQISLLVTEVATENACIPEAKSFLPVIVSMYKYSKSTAGTAFFSLCIGVQQSYLPGAGVHWPPRYCGLLGAAAHCKDAHKQLHVL